MNAYGLTVPSSVPLGFSDDRWLSMQVQSPTDGFDEVEGVLGRVWPTTSLSTQFRDLGSRRF